MTGTVGTRFQNELNSKYINKSQGEFQKNQSALMTGVRAQTYADMAKDVSRSSSYVNQQEKLNAFIQNGEVVSKQLQYQERMVNTIISNLIYFKEQLVGSNAPEMAQQRQLGSIAERMRDVLEESLSVSNEGRYIFGGLKQDQIPINTKDPALYLNGTYYTGSDELVTLHFKELKRDVPVGITANHKGFQDAFESIQMVINNPYHLTTITNAQPILDDAIRELSDALAVLGGQQAKIEDDVRLNKDLNEILDEFLTTVFDVDVTEASTNVQIYKNRLEASWLLLQAKPRVIDYLR